MSNRRKPINVTLTTDLDSTDIPDAVAEELVADSTPEPRPGIGTRLRNFSVQNASKIRTAAVGLAGVAIGVVAHGLLAANSTGCATPELEPVEMYEGDDEPTEVIDTTTI